MSSSQPDSLHTTPESKRGLLALMVAHCAGMVDLVALPIWVGSLMSRYKFDPQQAGGLVTLFLIGTALASVFFAARFARHDGKRMVVRGFGVAALALAWASQEATFAVLAVLHLIGGVAAGTALTFTHGTIGSALRPHRTFAFAGLAIGLFGILILGGAPHIIDRQGGPALFWILSAVMAVACIVGWLFFPRPSQPASHGQAQGAGALPLGRAVWYAIVAIALMCTVQAMTASFIERVGMARGFGREAVTTALVIFGIVTVFPGPLAGLLEKRLTATAVTCSVPILQAIGAMLVTHSHNYVVYVVACAMMPFAIIFTHTFAFGLLARLDPTGRAVAGTPAMIMVGAATGPFISGTLVKFIGFEAIGYAAVVLVACELFLYNLARKAVAERHGEAQGQPRAKLAAG